MIFEVLVKGPGRARGFSAGLSVHTIPKTQKKKQVVKDIDYTFSNQLLASITILCQNATYKDNLWE